jgi:thiol-disulfide isomerase/thioredoxin
MRKLLAVLLELAIGLIVVAVLFVDVRVLLQSPVLIYLFLPVACVITLCVGNWRGRTSPLAGWQVVTLINLPMVIVAATAGRAWLQLLALPVLGAAFTGLGVAVARGPAARRPWRALVPLLVIVLVVLGALGPRFARSLVFSDEQRQPAVAFRFTDLATGAVVGAEQLRGRVVVIDFWATWCVPCQHELPELDRIAQRFAGDRRVAFYAVDVPMTDTPNDQGDTPERARALFGRRGFRLPLGFDAGGSAAVALHAHGLPTLIVLDRTGQMRLRRVGYTGAEDLGAILSDTLGKLLAEGAANPPSPS